MAELVIGAVVTALVDKLASGITLASAESVIIHSKLEKWSDTLPLIQAVLVQASQKHIQDNEPVQLWLNKLSHLAYEIDDVLDDFITEATRHRLNQESHTSTSKVIKFIPNKLHTLKYNHKMSSKLDEITSKLHDLVKQKKLLGLTDKVEKSVKGTGRVQETSLVDHASKIIGREGDKEALLGKLLGGETSSSQACEVNVVSIVGLGGIGKTTLARLLYNDKKVVDHFELRAWVCVSDVFDVFNISKAIFQAVGGENQDFANLDLLQKALSEKIKEKRFLIVLDDVWNENFDKWKSLRLPFTVGAAGSKVLVTTRNYMVAEVMKSVEPYSLELLSYEEAISLFAQHVSGSQKFDVNRALELHGKDIVKKCHRLPLALVALGRVFGKKSNVEEWVELLNSEIWNSKKEPTVLPALKLSYYDLPSHLKRMFVYCCLFPKDYTFDKDELVLLWMAEGFLYESKGNNSMESFGRECFEELLSRSFFQHLSGDKSHYTMHDLINDLATSVAGDFFLVLADKMNVHNRIQDLEKCHHLSFFSVVKYGAGEKFKALKNCKHVRTFLATFLGVSVKRYSRLSCISKSVLTEVLPQFPFLRVLSLAGHNIKEVPRILCSLKHLRYLNVSRTLIACLPEQVGDLLNLQSLLVSGCCNLSSFPNSFVKLINLRHLDISDTPQLNKMSLGAIGLSDLQNLSKIVTGEYNSVFRISDLKVQLNFQGELSIKGLQELKNAIHANDAKLQKMKENCDFHMEWRDVFDASRNKATEYELLEGLRPFEKLRSLKISYYGGTKFPSWVGDPSFVCLSKLTLRSCKSCKRLPALGHLPSLQELTVDGMDGLEKLDFEFLGCFDSCQDVVAFPSLEVLKFKDMKSWEEWSTSGGDIARVFPCLREIHMINCVKLDVVAIELMPSLRLLHVEGCSIMMLRSMVSVSPIGVELSIKKIKGLTQLSLEHLKAVGPLFIYDCDELTHLFSLEEDIGEFLLSLKKLEVSKCGNLVSLGEKEMQSVTEVKISDCERLESYNCPSGIEKLEIIDCTSLTSLSFPTMNDLPPTLKSLEINWGNNVEVSWVANNFLSSLKHLCMCYLPNLRLLPEGCLVHLTELVIQECYNIESIPDNGYGFLPSRCLKRLEISGCKNLKSFPYKHLQSLESLEEMKISNCPSLDESFPCGMWPPNLSELFIGGLKKPMSEWGIQNFPTSLAELSLYGDNENSNKSVSFGKGEGDITTNSTSSSSFLILPSSLITLVIRDFKKLESVSEGLQHLTSLKFLFIHYCPKLRDLPETILPSLLLLDLTSVSRELEKNSKGKGKYWPIISQIPNVAIERKSDVQ